MPEEPRTSSRSAFGGHPISKIPNVDAAVAKVLAGLGLDEAEQIIAVASLPAVRPELSYALRDVEPNLDRLLNMLHEAVPPAVAAAVQSPSMTSFNLGALRPTPEIEAVIKGAVPPAAAAPIALPPNVNHAKLMPPIRNQGGRGTCVAHALTAVHEFYRKMSGAEIEFSEQFLYHETKQIDGAPMLCGTWQLKARDVLSRLGECREATWQYNPVGSCNNNGVEPGSARSDAANYRLETIVLDPTNVGQIKAALAGGSVVGFSIPVYNSWFLSPYTKQTGRINMPIGNEPSSGGHAMCLIGYQDDDASPGGGFFILRNSWDISWGEICPFGAGNGTIPYGYIATDCWEAVTSETPTDDGGRCSKPDWTGRPEDPPQQGRPSIVVESGGRYDIVIK